MSQLANRVHEVGASFDPIKNLEQFIARARKQQPYEVVWNSAVWNIEASDTKKRAHLTNNLRLYFTEHAGARVPLAGRAVFESPYADLIKGFFRLLSGFGHELEASTMEIYRAHKITLIAEATRCVFNPLNA